MSLRRMESCSGASMPILTRRPVPPSNVIKMGPLAKSCASVMLTSTPSAGWITIDSSARRLKTSMASRLRQSAQRFGKGLSLRAVSERRSASHNAQKLVDLTLPQIDDVAVDFVRGAATGHQLHQRAPARGDRLRNAGAARNAGAGQALSRGRAQSAALVLEPFDGSEKLRFFRGLLLDRLGRCAGQGAAFGIQGSGEHTRDINLAIQ